MQHIWEQAILLGLGRNRNVYAERLIFLYDEEFCVYPAQNLENFRYSAGGWVEEPFFKDVEKNGYFIERDAGDYFGESDSRARFTTYWAALKDKNQQKVGIIGLQLSQDKFYDLLPSTVLEAPYQLSFITMLSSKQDAEGNNPIIWQYYEDDIDEEQWSSIVSKMQVNIKKDKSECDEVDCEPKDDITFDDEVRYHTWQVHAPIDGITTHPNYKRDNLMIVICGQKSSLLELIKSNLRAFIKTDLIYFQLILLFFNMCIFVGFTWFFEKRLQTKVTKPIQELTKQIKNPKDFFSKNLADGKEGESNLRQRRSSRR